MLTRSFSRLLIVIYAIFSLPSEAGASEQKFALSPKTASDIELLTIYGAFIRANYRNNTNIGEDTFEFIEIEKELEERRLIDRKAFKEVELGLVYLKMPLLQLYASIDGLLETEVVSFPPHTLQVFKSGPVPDPTFGNRKNRRQTFLACNGQLIGSVVSGLTTFETYSGVEQTDSKTQTNFKNDFLELKSAYMRRWLEKGRIWKSRQRVSLGAAGHLYYILTLHNEWDSLKAFLEYSIKKGRYPQFKRYFDKVC